MCNTAFSQWGEGKARAGRAGGGQTGSGYRGDETVEIGNRSGLLLPTLLASTLALPSHQSALAQTLRPAVGQIPLKMPAPGSQTPEWHWKGWRDFHLFQATKCHLDGTWRPRTGVSEKSGETACAAVVPPGYRAAEQTH